MCNTSLPKGWVSTHLGSYLCLKNGFAFKSKTYCQKGNATVPIIRISDIDGKTASDQKASHVPDHERADGFEVNTGDLLIAMSGATTGKVGVYQGNVPAYQNQRVGNLKLLSEKNGSSVFRNYLISSLTTEILKAAYGGAQPNISGKAIEELSIDLPSLAE
jgi:type I restriction enzyme S subunit